MRLTVLEAGKGEEEEEGKIKISLSPLLLFLCVFFD
jgi:hypothetical protein